MQFNRKPILTSFMLICFVVSSLMVFITSSMITNQSEVIKKQNFGYNENQTMTYAIDLKAKATYKDLKDPIDKLKDDYLLFIFRDIEYGIDGIPVQAVFFYGDTSSLKLSLSQGKFLDKNNKNSIVMGINLYNKLDNPETVSIYGKSLEINGVCDKTCQNSILSFIEPFEETFFKNNTFFKTPLVLRVIKKDGKISNKDRNYLLNSFSNTEKMSCFEFWGKKRSTLSAAVDETKRNIKLNILLIFIAAFNIIVISSFWITDRKKEIAIRKAFGAEGKHIIKLIYKELAFIMLLAVILSFLLQQLLLTLLSKFLRFELSISPLYLVAILLVAFALTVLASIIPIYRSLKMQVSQCLKE
ncbi:MAG: FtsX-like permease family protein [Clostridium sp.]|uniref:ABC transporter permease n=2 Tax=Clostridium sp. TaxID=1506 RepID=UPI00321704E0|nr:FtsX-like permease family protein [Clostridium sp.]